MKIKPYYQAPNSDRKLPVDDLLDYLTGHYRHLNGITYPDRAVRFKHGPIERELAERQGADHARQHDTRRHR